MLILLCAIVLILISWNAVAIMHVRAMTRFVPEGQRTASPEELNAVDKIKTLVFGVRMPRPENSETPADYGLEFESMTINSSAETTLGLWHVPNKNAKTIVLLCHGYGASKASLLDEAAAFVELGMACVLMDFPGSGESSGNRTTIGYNEADDVRSVVDHLQATFPEKKLILFGQSMGAAAVLRSSSIHQNCVDAIIIEAVFDTLLQTVINRFNSMGVPPFPSAQLLTFWGGVVMGVKPFAHNPVDYAEGVRQPTLVLHGSDDPRARLGEGKRVFSALSGPKKLVVFDGVKHESFQGDNVKKWRTAVRDFVGEHVLTPANIAPSGGR